MQIDRWILTFSALTVIATIWMGFWSARRSKSASDFFVAGRSVSVGWNASAISGEYLSAASFMGVAAMVMSSGYDALWYPVCYACGYLFLLLFIAGPLRRFGAYTIPDFAEGRFDSPRFRKIAVIFVLFIGFFYTMPQMKGAGTTLAYIFPGLPYWVGVVLVGAVITMNVALGGMKGITLVQAFQYWLKMFAISVPIFVLMAVYGGYGQQLGMNKARTPHPESIPAYSVTEGTIREPLPDKAPHDPAWLNPFGPLTTRAAKAAAARLPETHALLQPYQATNGLGQEIQRVQLMNFPIYQALDLYAQFERRRFVRPDDDLLKRLDRELGGLLQRAGAVSQRQPFVGNTINFNPQGGTNVPVESFLRTVEAELAKWDHVIVALDEKTLTAAKRSALESLRPAGNSFTRQEWLARHERPLALLYTYSLIIALVCGTAGLPHILVRFYTNPDGVAAKKTTMWVMILIGVFYVSPPVFGVMGRNLMPSLYEGAGAKGTDKVVLELPRILNERGAHASGVPSDASRGGSQSTNPDSVPREPGATPDSARGTRALPSGLPWGSILSGITCAGAFAAFMSTFSGLLVSMTGALAHDVYGRMLRPQSTPAERMRMFKWCAVLVGAVAMGLGSLVEGLEINFMVGQAFAIAAASYFPLLFMSVWWRGMTMRGAATGMLAGGLSALAAVALTNASTLAADPGAMGKLFAPFAPLNDFWAAHPLLRILCEQPAIWTVPLAIGLMIVVSKLTRRSVPADSRMKMLVLHAPEQLGLKQEYIREHEGH